MDEVIAQTLWIGAVAGSGFTIAVFVTASIVIHFIFKKKEDEE